MEFVWDDEKARRNLGKHGVDCADAVTALCDDLGLTSDEREEEERLITIGIDALGRVLVLVCNAAHGLRQNHLWPGRQRRVSGARTEVET